MPMKHTSHVTGSLISSCRRSAFHQGSRGHYVAQPLQRVLRKHFASSVHHGVMLRPYQEECIQAVLTNVAEGGRRLGISLATGSGKTVIFTHLIDRLPEPTPEATQTLILAHRKELVEQAAEHCRRLYPDKTIDIEMAGQHASGIADITVASRDSIKSGDRLIKYDPSRFKLVLVDEAHHIVSPGYMEVLRHFSLGDPDNLPRTTLVGVSATFSRLDGVGLGAAIDRIVFHKDYIDMMDEKFLSFALFTTVHSGVDLSKVRTAVGDFQTGALSTAVNNPESNAITVKAWLEKAEGRLSTLVFCVDVAHVADLTAMFREHGVDARFVTSQTPKKERAERLDDFKAKRFPVLLNCGIYTEGTDIPNVDCVLLARPTKSSSLLVQMIGRGLRLHDGKKDCHIIDMVTSLKTGIVTTPTLLGLDPDVLVDGEDLDGMKKLRDLKEVKRKEGLEKQAAQPTAIPALSGNITFTDYDSVSDLIEDTSGERHIRSLSRLAWLQINDDQFILSNRSGDYETIRKNDGADLWIVSYTRRLPPEIRKAKSPYARSEQVATALTFEAAVRAGDTYANSKFDRDFILSNAFWRRFPATEVQLKYLNRYREEGKKLKLGDIKKGKAGDWITKLIHGAKGRFNKIAKQKAAEEKAARKKEQWEKRQLVQVGPVGESIMPKSQEQAAEQLEQVLALERGRMRPYELKRLSDAEIFNLEYQLETSLYFFDAFKRDIVYIRDRTTPSGTSDEWIWNGPY